jgi:muramoyltetrapeptide carboxypeptidase
MLSPKPLKKGDTVHIVSTARFVEKEFIDYARSVFEDGGLKVKTGESLFKRKNQFAGSDTDKVADFNAAIADTNCRAIICARGGYGTARVIDRINIDGLKADPKWVVGYSDITVLLSHLYSAAGMASIHASMPVNFASNSRQSIDSYFAALFGKELSYTAPTHGLNKPGTAEGPMVGGNLSVLYSLLGSKSQMDTRGKILFIEDLDEYLYHIDRMMVALKRAGMLHELAGLIVGGMTDMNDNTTPFGQSAIESIDLHVKEFDFPVCYNFPSGHIDDNRAWVHGKKVRMSVEKGRASEIKG